MCQDLPLGWVDCLLVCAVQNKNFGCSAQFYIFTGTSNGSETFCTVFIYNFFIFYNFLRIVRVTEVCWMFKSLQTVLFSQIVVLA